MSQKLSAKERLISEEINGVVDGVPTKAALGGAQHGRGNVDGRGQHSSFIPTGINGASFRCWPDTKYPR